MEPDKHLKRKSGEPGRYLNSAELRRYLAGVAMGDCRADLLLENAGDLDLLFEGKLPDMLVRRAKVDAVADTGAVLMLVPQDMVESLGLRRLGKIIVTLADDRRVELERAGSLSVTVAGRTCSTDCLVGPPGCETLLGQIVLESLDLIVDPLRQTVTVRPESPFLPTLKMKKGFPAISGIRDFATV